DPLAPLDEIRKQEVPLNKWVAILPEYLEAEVVMAVATGGISAASGSPGVDLFWGLIAPAGCNGIPGGEAPIEAPLSFWFDAMERRCVTVRNRDYEFARSLGRISA